MASPANSHSESPSTLNDDISLVSGENMIKSSSMEQKDSGALLTETDPRSCSSGVVFGVIYIWSELKRSPGAYIWSIVTVFLSVQVLSVIISALSRSSLIFFRMAEEQTGEQDIIYTPGLSVDGNTGVMPGPLPLLNQTIIDLALAGRGTPYEPYVAGFDGNLRGPAYGLSYKNGYAAAGVEPPPDVNRTAQNAWFGGSGFGPTGFFDQAGHVRLDAMPSKGAGELSGVAGRFLMPVTASGLVRNDGWNPNSQSPLSTEPVKGTMAGIDSAREWAIALGRKFSAQHTNVPRGGIFLARSVLRGLGVDDSVISQIRHEARERQRHHWSYAVYSESNGRWEGGNKIPLFAAQIKPDLSILLNGAGANSSPSTSGTGTAEDPFIVSVVNIDRVYQMLQTSGIPAPNNQASWSEWANSPASTLLGPPSTWTNYTQVNDFINNNLPDAAKVIDSPIVVDIPLEEICRQWDALLVPATLQVGAFYYKYESGLPCMFGTSSEPFQATIVPVGTSAPYTYEVDTVALDASFQNYLAHTVRPGPAVGSYVTAMASITLAASPPATLAVADVVHDPAGKYAASLGSLILSEMQSTIAIIQNTVEQTLTQTIQTGPLTIDVNAVVQASSLRDQFPGAIFPDLVISPEFQLASVLQVNMTQVRANMALIQGQELVPSVFGMIGLGANLVGNAYDAKFWTTKQAAVTTSAHKVGPGLYSSVPSPCPPCYCEWTPVCTLASIHQTLHGMVHRVLQHTPFGNFVPSPDHRMEQSGLLRQNAYTGTSTAMTQALSSATASAGIALGSQFPAKTTLTLFEAVKTSLFLRYFLDAILIALVFVVLLLAVLTNYALCYTDTESHTFTFAMIRASGLSSMQLAILLLLKATFVAIIGSLTGIAGGALVMVFVGKMLDVKTSSIDSSQLTTAGIAIALVAGFLVPFAATIVPVQKALGQALVEAQIPHRTSLSTVTVTIRKLNDLGINVYTAAAAIMLIAYGFICFYLIPLAFVNNDIPMFLTLLMLILLAMILGLVMIVYLFIPKLAFLLTWLCSIKQPSTRKIVTQHLRAHWQQSKWYALHVCITVSFIVFTGTLLRLQTHSLGDMIRVLNGAHIVINSPSINTPQPVSAIRSIAQELESADSNHPYYNTVQGHSFVTYPLSEGAKGALKRQTRVSSLLQYPQVRQTVYGLDHNYANSIYEHLYEEENRIGVAEGNALRRLQNDGDQGADFMTPPLSLESGYLSSPLSSVLDGNYTSKETARQQAMTSAYQGVSWGLVNKAVQKSLGIDVFSTLTVQVMKRRNSADDDVNTGGITEKASESYWFAVKPRGVASRVPGFFFSNYDMMATMGSVLLHKDSFARVASVSSAELVFQRCMLKLRKNVSPNVREDQVQMMMRATSSGAASDTNSVLAIDSEGLVDTMRDSIELLEIMFTSLGVVVMVLAGVMGLVTVQSIVRGQAWEIAVLRSLGMKRTKVVWIYVLETTVLCVSAIMLGTIIGLVVSISLTLQFNMFMDSPFTMDFPVLMYFIMVGAALFISILATVIPTLRQTSPTISSSLRKM